MTKRSKAQMEADMFRTGRPPLTQGRARSESVRIRLTQMELAELKKQAKAAGLSVAAFIRKQLLED